MDTTANLDANKLTFAQREGKAPLPEPMQLEHISKRFRQLVWLAMETAIREDTETIPGLSDEGFYTFDSRIGRIFSNYRFNVREVFHTDIPTPSPQEDRKFAFGIIQQGEYHEVLTFIEYILRDLDCPTNLRDSLIDAFEEASIAYFVIQTGDQLTIAPRISKETSESLPKSFKTLHNNNMKASVVHLHQAAEHINKQQYPDSIVDSIHAVETVARKIVPESKTLGDAITPLEHLGVIPHNRLAKALHKLWAFTCLPNLRHAQIDQEKTDVGLDEAMLLFATCASFAAYLTSRHQKLQKQSSEDS